MAIQIRDWLAVDRRVEMLPNPAIGSVAMAPHSAIRFVVVISSFLVGCQHPRFMAEGDYIEQNLVTGEASPSDLPPNVTDTPTTVNAPEPESTWDLSLSDTIRIAVENNKLIREVRYVPAEAATLVEQELAVFDPVFEAGLGFGQLRSPLTSSLETRTKTQIFNGAASRVGTAPSPGLVGVRKMNAAGGLTSLSMSLDALSQKPGNENDLFHPRWDSTLAVGVEQPLLRGAGVEFNRSLILIAQSESEIAALALEVEVRRLLRDVERAYWQLYFSYQDMQSREVGVRLALALWQAEVEKLDARASTKSDVAQARVQYEQLRDSRMQALAEVLENEASLRLLLGLPPTDARRLVPVDAPREAELIPSWEMAAMQAYTIRPELKASRLTIKSNELALRREKNAIQPELTLAANYSFLGIEDSADQSLGSLSSNQFDEWNTAAWFRVPLGQRAAYASVRRAELGLMRARAGFRRAENDVLFELQQAYRLIISQYRLFEIRQARTKAAREFLEAQSTLAAEGKTSVLLILQAQSEYTDSLRDESLAVARYNQALVDWEFAVGTILRSDQVAIATEAGLAGIVSGRRAIPPQAFGRPIQLPLGYRQPPPTDPCLDESWTGAEDVLYDPSVSKRFGKVEEELGDETD